MSLLGLILGPKIPFINSIGDQIKDIDTTEMSKDAFYDISDIFEIMFDE